MRLQKYMAHCGVASRRKSEEIIKQGRVYVNGQIIREQGYKVNPGDKVSVDNKLITLEKKEVYLLNKPSGVVCTVKDEHNRKTVMDYIPKNNLRLYPVGRLDKDTTGLLLLTNDGELTHKLLHPSFEIDKTYIATVKGMLTNKTLNRLRHGIKLEDGITAPAKFNISKLNKFETEIFCTIHEGRNRQIRRMFQAVNHPVINLHRISFGQINLGNLPIGQIRKLSKNEQRWLQTIK